MRELEFPFDSSLIIKKKKSLKKRLLEENVNRNKKKIAILGGSTTHDIKDILELFLLNYGIEPVFYESEYAQYFQDVMFDNPELLEFSPDLIFIHTSTRNIKIVPSVKKEADEIRKMVNDEFNQFQLLWKKIEQTYHCPVIQNNFEQPFYRLLGNKDVSDVHGLSNYVNELNNLFYKYAQSHENFFINDINYLASCYGLQKWADPFYWHMYKYALSLEAIPEFSFNLANIIKSIYGKNKKAFVLDLDNTLWGGIVGDDGVQNIEIGQETPIAQLYSEFQRYIKDHKDLGILLTINSKNEEENALAGLNRPDSVLKPEDFIVIKANWNPKDVNTIEIASQLNIGADSLVFIDDNPAEREIVRNSVAGCSVPDICEQEHYINVIDRSGFFEVTAFSKDDLARNEMYVANVQRAKQESCFTNYNDYLLSLEMKAEILPFSSIYMSRIAQLTNKSNQFNLTTKRCSQADIENIAGDKNCITLYGKLSDKFGDNGVVSVVFGHIDTTDKTLFCIDLWLMSCRVLKRDMEFAMMDTLMAECAKRNIKSVKGFYYPTEKNKMVKDFYGLHGFIKIHEDSEQNATWLFEDINKYINKNKVILINGN